MADVDKRKVKFNMEPEYVVSSSSVYDPVKSEETDDEEESRKDIDTSKKSININVKEEAKVKTEDDDVSTDDEHSPEYVISSSSSAYDPVKGEETDDEELGTEDTNTSNELQHLHFKVKAEVKTEDDVSTDDDGYGSEKKERLNPTYHSQLLCGYTPQQNKSYGHPFEPFYSLLLLLLFSSSSSSSV